MFYPPGKEKKLLNMDYSLPTDVKATKTYEGDGDKIVFLQEEGDVIFVPSNWFHQVTNIVSIRNIKTFQNNFFRAKQYRSTTIGLMGQTFIMYGII